MKLSKYNAVNWLCISYYTFTLFAPAKALKQQQPQQQQHQFISKSHLANSFHKNNFLMDVLQLYCSKFEPYEDYSLHESYISIIGLMLSTFCKMVFNFYFICVRYVSPSTAIILRLVHLHFCLIEPHHENHNRLKKTILT